MLLIAYQFLCGLRFMPAWNFKFLGFGLLTLCGYDYQLANGNEKPLKEYDWKLCFYDFNFVFVCLFVWVVRD